MKISKALQRVLDEMSEGGNGFWEEIDLQEKLNQGIERALGPDDELWGPSRQPGGLYAQVDDEHWVIFKYVSQCEFDIADANCRGAALRIHHDAPDEYARHMSLAARTEWLAAKTNWKYNWDELWRPLLCSAATHDSLAMSRLLELYDNRRGKANNRAYVGICMGLAALVRQDDTLLAAAVEETKKRKAYSYVTGINMALDGVQSAQPDLFAQGLDQMLRRFKGYMFGEAAWSLIEPFAHGLYELAKRYDHHVVQAFDASRKLPWDAEYCEWIASVDDIASYLEKLEMPSFLRRALIEMEDMDWAPDNRPQY